MKAQEQFNKIVEFRWTQFSDYGVGIPGQGSRSGKCVYYCDTFTKLRMFGYLIRFLLSLFAVLLFQRCAQMSPLTGGARDNQAPKLLLAQPPLYSTDFRQKKIILTFNEYVRVGDLQNNLVVLPKIRNLPDVEAEGKKIIVRIDTADLKKNTTYRLNFGDAIADLNEGNPVRNFEYVFSTGGFVDSLKLQGSVSDALENTAMDNILIGLYEAENTNDSVLFKNSPDYITRSNKGTFQFTHLPAGTFRAYAMEDLNKNLNYDPDAERIGFLGKDLSLPGDSFLNFSMFKEIPYRAYVKKSESPYYGHTRIILNKTTGVKVSTLHPGQLENLFIEQNGGDRDTLLLFYKDIEDSLSLVLKFEESGKVDTLQISLPKRSQKKRNFAFIRLNIENNKLARKQPLKLTFINWMDTGYLVREKIKLQYKVDSIWINYPLQKQWKSRRELQLCDSLPEGRSFVLKLDTAAFRDAFMAKNDSVLFRFNTESLSELGDAVLNMQFYRKEQHLVQLLNSSGLVQRSEPVSLSLSSSNSIRLHFKALPPGSYRVRVVYDLNKNEKWDSGSLLKKQQAEAVFLHPRTINVLSDWEIEEEVKVKN